MGFEEDAKTNRELEGSLPSMGRVSLGVVGLVLATLMLRFSIHQVVATWLVFPAPVLNPSPPDVDTPLVLVDRARRHAPGEAQYWFMSGQLHLQQMRARWLRAEALSQGTQAAAAADKAVELLAENPYYHRLAGSVAIDLARHPATSEVETKQYAESALTHMQNALERSPSSPLLHQQVGLELLKVWPLLDETGKDIARRALHLAATWESGRLETSLAAVWARAPRQETLDLLETVTPDTADSRDTLGRFLAEEAERFAPSDQRLSWDLGSRALRAHRRAMDLADLGLEHLERWARTYERLRSDQPDQFLAAAQELAVASPQRPEAHFVLGRALSAAGRPEEAREAAGRAVSLAAARLREHLSSSEANTPSNLETGIARLRWELDRTEEQSPRDLILRDQVEVYAQMLRYEADLLFDHGSYTLALERYRRLAVLASGDPYPSVQLGRTLDALGQADEALEMYRSAVRVAPRSTSARAALARAYLDRHEYLEAIREWRAVASRNRRALAPRLEIARAYREMGLLEEAVRAYSDALELNPSNTAVQREMEAVVGRLQGAQVRRD